MARAARFVAVHDDGIEIKATWREEWVVNSIAASPMAAFWRLDRSRRRPGDGAKARPRRADHRYAGGLSRRRVAGRSHHQGQGRPHGGQFDRQASIFDAQASCLPAAAAPISPRRPAAEGESWRRCHETLGCVLARRVWSGLAFAQDRPAGQHGLGLSGDAQARAARQRAAEQVAGQHQKIHPGAIDVRSTRRTGFRTRIRRCRRSSRTADQSPRAAPARNAICRRATAIRNRRASRACQPTTSSARWRRSRTANARAFAPA